MPSALPRRVFPVRITASKSGVAGVVKQFVVGATVDVREGLIHSWEMAPALYWLILRSGNGQFEGAVGWLSR